MAKKKGPVKPALKLLTALNDLRTQDLRYLIIGGTAAVLYGVKRATFDIDVGVMASLKKIDSLINTFKDLGYKTIVDPMTEEKISDIQDITKESVRKLESFGARNGHEVDVLLIPDVDFKFMWEYKIEVQYEGVTIPIPSILDLIRLKEKSSRPVDQEDVRQLKHILRTTGGKDIN